MPLPMGVFMKAWKGFCEQPHQVNPFLLEKPENE